MAYSRLLNLGQAIEDELKAYLDNEIPNHLAERSQYQQQLVEWNKDYWAEPIASEKTFPFKGACNIIIPITAIAVESIHASNMTTLFGLKDFVNVNPRSPLFGDAAKPFEDYANHELSENIQIKKKMESGILTCEKFGNGIAKSKYRYDVKYGVREIGGVETEFPVVTYNGADIECTHPSRFMMPFSSQDPQLAPWCGETHETTIEQIGQNERSGMFAEGTEEKLRGYLTTANVIDDVQNAQEVLEKRSPIAFSFPIQYYEIWLDFRVDSTKIPKAIQVFYHYESRTFMGIRYNSNSDLRRPHRIGTYIPVEHRWAGIGICKQNDQAQLEITIQHRQRIDNATLANMRMFKVNKMSGYGPREPIFPGKMWFLDDMNDLEAFQAGEIYPSAYNNEQQTLIYAQQRSGVNEGTLGMPSQGTPGTATAELSRVQEGKRKSDYTLDNIRNWVNDVVYDVFDITQTYRCWDSKYLQLNDPTGQVLQILSLPNEAIRDSLIFKINIAGQNSNNILDRQNWQQIAQFTTQYYTQMIRLVMQSGNQQMMQFFIQKAMTAGTEVMAQLLTAFGVRNQDRILPLELLQMANSATAIGNQGGGLLNAGPQSTNAGDGSGGNAATPQIISPS